jgi:ATP-dependent DNA helicase 2 subunit 2
LEKPLSGLDVEALLGREKRIKISPENAIPEFKQMLATTEDPNGIRDAAKQMATIVHSIIEHSVGDSGYGRAIEAVRVMKEELMDLEEPGIFNDFIRDLKTRILNEKDLGGDRRDLWWKIRGNKLGLIDKKMSSLSTVSEEEAKEVSFARLQYSEILNFSQFYSTRLSS